MVAKYFYKEMPEDLREQYLHDGLEAFAKVLGENKFELLYKTLVKVNSI